MNENNLLAVVKNNDLVNFLQYDQNQYYNINKDQVFHNGSTLLSWAVRNADLKNITHIVEMDANVNQREQGGATPLLLAVHLRRFEIVHFLIRKKANVNLGDSYDTPLMVAVRKGYSDMIEFLVDSGANINIPNIYGISPLFWAIKENKSEILELLVKKGVPEDALDASRNSPLIAAVKNKSSIAIFQILLKHGAAVSGSPLAWATAAGQLEIVKILTTNGANLNIVDESGNTTLATAVRLKQYEVVEYLTNMGANICKTGPNGKTPLLWAVQNQDVRMVEWLLDYGADYIIDSVFLDAIQSKNLGIVQLLGERGASWNKRDKQTAKTPLAKALEVESVEIAMFLLEKGTKVVDDLDNEITVALEFLENENIEMVKLLTENGARLEKTGDCGHTLLTKAVQLENFEMVKYFLGHNVEINQANDHNQTPLTVAARNRDFRTFQYLVHCGAEINEDEEDDEEILQFYRKAKKNNLKKAEENLRLYSAHEDANEQTKEEKVDEVSPEEDLRSRGYLFIEFD